MPPPSPPAPASAGGARVLLLTSDTGAGHRSVARALIEAAAAREGFRIELVEVDPLAPLPAALTADGRPEAPTPLDRFVALYGPVIVRAPWLWGLAFHAADNRLGLRAYLALAGGRVADRIVQATARTGAQAIVSVHPLVNHAMERARERLSRPDVPLLTVLTDLVDVHRWWAAGGVDRYVASSDVAAGRLHEMGIAPQRITTLGIPIRAAFARAATPGRDMRRQLGLDEHLPLLLLMGGGDGAGRLVDTARAVAELAGTGLEFQLVVVAGRNRRALAALESHRWPVPARVLGFVANIDEYMVAADVIATKPGSLTVSEALALGRPLLLGRPLPGQEVGNVAYVAEAGAGFGYRSPREAFEAAEYLLRDPAARWEMGQNAFRLGKPRAAERTLDVLQAMLVRHGAAV